ncbi:uncharacterized protein LOC117780038 [Drosophila innubila]|uniref:uncharacterized protein LOC117780038 n=1 Tax=Drosophila innubila TaxID=198719 RepID=UPI00148E1E3A|nr:uncharacterized protein LOC117780038 [Drosophila innubila]
MYTVKKCCCFPLKKGVLAIAIIEIILGLLECVYNAFTIKLEWPTCTVFGVWIIHFIGCILLIVSIWVQKSPLPIWYLVTNIIRMLAYIAVVVWGFFAGQILNSVGLIIAIFLFIYFWICVFSWFMELRDLES